MTAHGPFLAELEDIYAVAAEHATLITISQAQADSAGKVPVGAVIHHGLDPEDYPQGNGGDQYLFVGRCCPDKGVREAVLAAKQADVRLVLAMKVREPDEVDYVRGQVEPLLDDSGQHVGESAATRRSSCFARRARWSTRSADRNLSAW